MGNFFSRRNNFDEIKKDQQNIEDSLNYIKSDIESLQRDLKVFNRNIDEIIDVINENEKNTEARVLVLERRLEALANALTGSIQIPPE
jgi:septal ring factor EnvC (AmiA/AmiB activator)